MHVRRRRCPRGRIGSSVQAGGTAAGWWPAVVGGVVALVGALLWCWHTPPAGDLAAQTAWAQLVHRAGYVPWFGRWYGGVSVGGYSLVAPGLMALFGVRAVGVLATVGTGLVAGRLLSVGSAVRPGLGAAAFALAAVSDLYSGRVTFALGGVVALVAVLAAERRRVAGTAAAAGLSVLTSPVAGLFLLIPAAVLIGRDSSRRRAGLAMAAAVALVGALDSGIFPDGGREPFAFFVLRPALAIGVVAALLPTGRRVRSGLVLGAGAVLAAYLVTSPVGSNITRLTLLVVIPTIVAAARLRASALAVVVLVLGIWPWQQLRGDLVLARQASAQPGFSAGLAGRLAGVRSERVEVVEPRTHWAMTVLVNDDVTIARGWERQADEAQNPLFYGRAPLTVASYRSWLDAHAVAYVALPVDGADIDFGSAAEARLVRSGLPYLRPVWSDPHWVLYAVRDPAPVSSPGATVIALTDTGAVIRSPGPATVTLALRWSRWLVVTGGRVQRDGSGVRLVLTSAGLHQLHAVWRWPALVP